MFDNSMMTLSLMTFLKELEKDSVLRTDTGYKTRSLEWLSADLFI